MRKLPEIYHLTADRRHYITLEFKANTFTEMWSADMKFAGFLQTSLFHIALIRMRIIRILLCTIFNVLVLFHHVFI